MKNDKTFEEFLKHSNLSQNTQTSYLRTIKYYTENYDSFSKENLLAYKGFLMEYFKSKTENLRLQGINKYLQYIHKEELQLKFVKVQQKNFLENVISNADYQVLKTQIKKDNNLERYFVVWFLAANGARVSELVQIKVEHVRLGYFDLYSKGGKLRRLYIPKIRASFLLRGESQAKGARPSVFGRRYNLNSVYKP
jgi:integrase